MMHQLTQVDWEDKEDQEGVDQWTMLHMVMHVMETKGVSIALLQHEMMENHDGYQQEPHPTEEMT